MSRDLLEKSNLVESQKNKIKQIEKYLQAQKSRNEGISNTRHPKPKQLPQAEDPDSLKRP